MRRSMLFMPGNNAGMLLNADILGADAVILDLEDAVSPAEKDAARILVRNAIQTLHYQCEVCVRINSIDTAFWKQDLNAILPLKPSLIMPPKISTAQDVLTVDAYMTELEDKLGMERNTVKLIPLIETALGVENAFAIASSSPRVAAMLLGGAFLMLVDDVCRSIYTTEIPLSILTAILGAPLFVYLICRQRRSS